MIKNIIKNILKSLSYEIKKIHQPNVITFDEDHSKEFENFFKICQKESLNVSKERFLSLFQTVNYIYKNRIEGDIVECGVFMGGSAMMMALSMNKFDNNPEEKKKLWLYDTYQGMANAHENDVNILNDKAIDELKKLKKTENSKDIWAYSSIDYVKDNMNKTGIDNSKIIYVEGLVEETLNSVYPDKISILRLDTDFYLSTKKELEILYPKLQIGGVIIIDDYGHWKGCKKAVDEYFKDKKNIFFQQIDYSGLVGIKVNK